MSSRDLEYPNCRVINIIGAPCAGKTTIASLIFAKLKLRGAVAEYVPEYAKKLVWEKKFAALDNQYQISFEQYELIKAIYGRVEFIVTDGPLVNGLYYNAYNPHNVSNREITHKKILEYHREFSNINIYLTKGNFKYEQQGRMQTESEAAQVDRDLREILDRNGVVYNCYESCEKIADVIVERLLSGDM